MGDFCSTEASIVTVLFCSNILMRSLARFSLGPLTGLGGKGNRFAMEVTEFKEFEEMDERGSVRSETLSRDGSNDWRRSKLGV